jgi:hypothetical protein
LPAAGAWLLLAGTAGLVVLLYWLKPSARRLVVSSGLIWRRVLESRKRRAERWRWWLSLMLALGIALAIAAALTRPEIAAVSGAAADVLLVIDTGPSMAARGPDGRTRLARALDSAEAVVRASGAGSRYLVADTTHQVATPALESREDALARLRTLAPRAGAQPWFPDVARPAGPGQRLQLWFFTDGVADLAVPRQARLVSAFQMADNLGITAFEVRALPADARRHEAYLEITNASPGDKRVEVQVVGVGAAPLGRALQLRGGAAADVVLDLSAFEEGPLRATLRTDTDALDLDNTAYAYLPGKGRVRVGLFTAGNPALAQALRLLPRVEVAVATPERWRDSVRFDAVVLDRFAPPRPPAVPALLIAPGPVSWLPRSATDASDIRLARWDTAHPLLANVSLRDVLVDRAPLLALDAPRDEPGSAQRLPLAPLARGARNEPLILATREGPRLALLSFALEASNFAQQASFPAFLSNAVDWLTREPRALAYRIGQVSVPAVQARVLDLEGRVVQTRPAPSATLFDVAEPGLFTALTREQRVRIAVNALDPQLTAINASRLARGFAPAAPPAPVPARLRIDPWVLLLALATLLLAVEWWTYNRRVTV